MDASRRDFLKRAALAGGVVLGVFPACTRARDEEEKTAATDESWRPAYARLEDEGLLAARVEEAARLFESCRLCPRQCGVNRRRGETGYCRAPAEAMVSTSHPHFGEELPLTGRGGSGTIFFANCNLRCVFCQNWPISHKGRGRKVTDDDLAGMMLDLQERGCHNINLVTPTHVMPNILAATRIALGRGLRLPLVYNTSGYERTEIVRLLDGIVDIHMPDMKFMDAEPAALYMGAPDYPAMAAESIREMFRQVGPLQIGADGLATRGLMIRHLVMPNRLSNAQAFVQWVAKELAVDVYVNIMAQYRVEYRAFEFPPIARAITAQEFTEAIRWAREAGLTNLDERSAAHYRLFRLRG